MDRRETEDDKQMQRSVAQTDHNTAWEQEQQQQQQRQALAQHSRKSKEWNDGRMEENEFKESESKGQLKNLGCKLRN